MKELTTLKSLNNKKLLVVLPLNKLDDILLNECLFTLAEQEYSIDLLVLTNKFIEEQTNILNNILKNPTLKYFEKDADGNQIEKITNSKNTLNFIIENTFSETFSEVYNEAFNYANSNEYELLSVVEYRDAVSKNWFKLALDYIEAKTEFDGFVPVIREMSNGNFMGYFNELNWCEGMAEAAGTFDLSLMLKYSCINITGGVFKVNSIKQYSEEINNEYKAIKESIEIASLYEFFLRMVYNDLKIYTIPRLGYERRNDSSVKYDKFNSRPNIISPENIGMDIKEFKHWNSLPIKEYFFVEGSERAAEIQYKS